MKKPLIISMSRDIARRLGVEDLLETPWEREFDTLRVNYALRFAIEPLIYKDYAERMKAFIAENFIYKKDLQKILKARTLQGKMQVGNVKVRKLNEWGRGFNRAIDEIATAVKIKL